MNWKKRKKLRRLAQSHGCTHPYQYKLWVSTKMCYNAINRIVKRLYGAGWTHEYIKARLQRSIYEAACNTEFKYSDADYPVQELPVKYTFSFHVEVNQNESG